MLKTLGGAKRARILITLTAVCSLVLAMLAAGVSPVKADDPADTVTTKSVQDATPNKADLNKDLEGEIITQEQSFAGGDIDVAFKGKGVADGTKVDLWLFSTPTDLGTKTVEDGKVEVTVPSDVAVGSHTLAAYDQDGEQLGWTGLTVIQEPAKQAAKTTTGDAAKSDITPMAVTNKSSEIVITARTNAKALATKSNTSNTVRSWNGSSWVTTSPSSVDSIKLGSSASFGDTSMTNGASYRLHAYNSAQPNTPGAAINDSWATCTVASGGQCTIEVPNTQQGGANFNKQFWVVQVNAPAGTYSNPSLVLGDSSLASPTTWNVPGLTQPMAPGGAYTGSGSYTMPRAAGSETDQSKISFGAVPYSIINPAIVAKCTSGITIALVLDVSGSISSYRTQYKNAITGAAGLLDSLAPTGSKVASFTFASNSPRSSSIPNVTTPKAITATGTSARTALNTQINNQIDTSGGNQYTNWDAGFQAVRNASEFNQYDYVLFVTDGAPNRIVGNGGNPASGEAIPIGSNGADISVSALEAAVYSANSIKAAGKPVVSVAVGNGVTHAGANLRAISGETKGKDYFQSSSWTDLNNMLKEQAQSATCGASVTVTKETPNNKGEWTKSQGWDMKLGVNSSDSVTTTPQALTQTTPASGTVNWDLQFTKPDATADITINETQKEGWEFREGTCTVGDRTITLDSTSTSIPGVKRGDQVNCTFRNAEIPSSWTLEKSSNPASGSTVKPGDEITYTVTAKNPSNNNVSNIKVEDDLTKVLNNADLVSVNAPAGTSVNSNADITSTKTLKWNVGTLAKTSERVLTYKVKVKDSALGVKIDNVVTGTGSVAPEPCPTDKPDCRQTEHFTPKWTLAKTSNPASGTKVTPGQKILYTLTATNSAGADVAGVIATDDLSAVLNNATLTNGPTTANGSASLVGNQLIWNVGTLAKNSIATVTYEVTINGDAAGVTINNSVSGASNSVPPVDCKPAAPCTTTHTTDPAWNLAKTSDPATGSKVVPGQEITYTVTASNPSKSDVANVVVSDNLSDVLNNATLVGAPEASTGSANVSSNKLTWTLGSIGAGKTETVKYTVKVNADALGVTIGNTVSGDGAIPPTTCTEAKPCTTTHTTDPVWNLAKTSNPATGTKVTPGQEITYTVTATNPSKSDIAGVVVNDNLSNVLNNASFKAGSIDPSAGNAVRSGNQLTWTLGKLGAGKTETVKYTVKVNDNAFGVTIGNVVSGDSTTVPPATCTAAQPCETTHNTDPTWSLAKTSDPATGSKVVPGQEITYTVTATNPSKSDVANIKVNDNLSNVLNNSTMVGAPVTANGTASVVANQLVWELGTLAKESTATVTYTVKVNADAIGVTIGNVVSGDGDIPPTTCTEAKPCETTHETTPAWTLAKTSNPATGSTVKPGDEILYTVTATNGSKGAVKNVVVNDDLSQVLNNATLIEGPTASAGSANIVGDALTWNAGELAAGTSATVTYKVKVNDDALGVAIGNTVSGNSDTVPPLDCTVEKPCTTTHETDPIWTLEKSSDPASGSTILPGATINYTVTAKNPSKSAVKDVVVKDDLSQVLNNAAFTGGPTASAGSAERDGNELTWTLGTIAAGATETVKYTVKVNADATGVTVGNVVTGDAEVPVQPCPVEEGQEANNNCRETEHFTPSYTLVKSSDPGSGSKVEAGSDVKYTLTVNNNSERDINDELVINDDLSDVLNNAVFDDDSINASVGNAVHTDNDLKWTIPSLAAGETATVDYTVKVNEDAHGVTLKNVATGDADFPVDPCPVEEGQEANNDCRETTHNTDPVWTMDKTSNPPSGSVVQPGDEIEYTVTAKNPSKSGINNVVVKDDLSNVLNHSTFVGEPVTSVGSANREGNALTWTIPEFAAGSEATVTYKVKVNANANGVTVNNVVFGNASYGEEELQPEKCTEQEPCTTTHNTPPVESPTGPTDPAVTPTPTDSPSGSTDPAVTPTDGGNTDDSGVLPQTGGGLTVMFAILALILIGGGLVLRYASRQRKH